LGPGMPQFTPRVDGKGVSCAVLSF
jgi:hypothetical protein